MFTNGFGLILYLKQRIMSEDILKTAYSAEAFRTEGHKLVDLLADYLQDTMVNRQGKVIKWMPPEDAAAHCATL